MMAVGRLNEPVISPAGSAVATAEFFFANKA
jgi:hypothetical protein